LVGNGKLGNRPGAKVIVTKGQCAEMCKTNRPNKEIEMSANRLFTLLVVAAFVAVIAFATQGVFATGNHIYHQSQQQALREYSLAERYGALPQVAAQISLAQTLREYQLGERYGETPLQPDREYMLGERYGVTPLQPDREYILGERYGVTP
jgi:hypothetical protein